MDEATLTKFLVATRDVFRRCSVFYEGGLGLLASPPEGKYPFVYTRDFAVAIVALSELGDYCTAKRACSFLLACQLPTGEWVQRYDDHARRQDAVVQEDNTALAVWALLTYANLSGDTGLKDAIKGPVLAAAAFMAQNTLHLHVYLAITHTSIHETAVSEGFEIWNSCAHARAFRLVAETYDIAEYGRYADLMERAITNLLTHDGRFLRRLDPHGNPDLRADITLLAPFYFNLYPPDDPTVKKSVALIERVLKDPELGGYTRYLAYSKAEMSVLPGPWFFYTAWMARYYYLAGDKGKGDEIIAWIMAHSKDFYLPEHLLSRPRWQRYKGLYAKRIEAMTDERCRAARRREYENLVRQAKVQRISLEVSEVLYGVLPLLWSHVETLRALQAGGYIEKFALEE
jgi:GH15 family glucan-1,4-alpha-glucosidase